VGAVVIKTFTNNKSAASKIQLCGTTTTGKKYEQSIDLLAIGCDKEQEEEEKTPPRGEPAPVNGKSLKATTPKQQVQHLLLANRPIRHAQRTATPRRRQTLKRARRRLVSTK